MRRAAELRILLLTALPLMLACNGVSWPSERIVRSLRVLAVQAEPASVTPGQSSQLSLLLADGIDSPDNGIDNPDAAANSDIDVAWFGACDNPPHNDPSKCLSQYAGWLDRISPVLADHTLSSTSASFQVARTFQFHAPDNVLQNQVTGDGQTIRYGNSYVYFAVCAGRLWPAAGLTDQLPVHCRDRSSNALLDQRRFVAGVTTLYAYDKVLNHNPQIMVPAKSSTQPQFASAVPYAGEACSVNADCHPDSAVPSEGGVPTVWACASDGVCVPRVPPCTKNVPGSCDPHYIAMQVADSSFVLTGLDGTLVPSPHKSLWMDCYANTGAWNKDDRIELDAPIVNNIADLAKSEWAGCSPWHAPTQPTDQARVWAVIRDDRGGIAWTEKRFVVR
jgi:hypothetical protein